MAFNGSQMHLFQLNPKLCEIDMTVPCNFIFIALIVAHAHISVGPFMIKKIHITIGNSK